MYESAHFALDLTEEEKRIVSDESVDAFLHHMDVVYTLFTDLVGEAPFDGGRVVIARGSPGENDGLAWAPDGSAEIFVNERFWEDFLNDLEILQGMVGWCGVESGVRIELSGFYGMYRELGRLFDSRFRWREMNAEFTASFKSYYIWDFLNGVDIIGEYKTLYDGELNYWAVCKASQSAGWEPFRKAFRFFSEHGMVSVSRYGLWNEFINRVDSYTDVDVRGLLTQEQWEQIENSGEFR